MKRAGPCDHSSLFAFGWFFSVHKCSTVYVARAVKKAGAVEVTIKQHTEGVASAAGD